MVMFKNVDGVQVAMTPAEVAEFEATQAAATPLLATPSEVMRHQGLLALLEFGITEAMIMAKVEAIEDDMNRERTRIRFMQPYWKRSSEFIAWGAEEFELTGQQVNQLFQIATTL